MNIKINSIIDHGTKKYGYRLALNLQIQTLNLYLENDTFIKLTKETAVARSSLALQALDLYKSCVKKNMTINLNTYNI